MSLHMFHVHLCPKPFDNVLNIDLNMVQYTFAFQSFTMLELCSNLSI